MQGKRNNMSYVDEDRDYAAHFVHCKILNSRTSI